MSDFTDEEMERVRKTYAERRASFICDGPNEPNTRAEHFDQHYRKLAAKLLNVHWVKFNDLHLADCTTGMGRLPSRWELQVIDRICELIPAMTPDKWERMCPYNHRKISFLKLALRHAKQPTRRGRHTTLPEDKKKVAEFEQWQIDTNDKRATEFLRQRYPDLDPSTFSHMRRRVRKAIESVE